MSEVAITILSDLILWIGLVIILGYIGYIIDVKLSKIIKLLEQRNKGNDDGK